MITLVADSPSGPWHAEAPFEDKDRLKAAGFWWHGQPCTRANCPACAAGIGKNWWTKDRVIASRIALSPGVTVGEQARLDFEQVAKAKEGSHAADAVIDVPAPDGCEYLPYQRAGIAYASGRARCLIADEMGLGKTIQALGVINSDESIQRVLVICPATIRRNWQREAEKWLVRQRPTVIIERDAQRILPGPALVIVNYERARRSACAERLREQGPWDLVIADESHRLKNPKSQQSKAVLGGGKKDAPGLIDGARRVLLLTGTPILNRPIELWPLAHAVAPKEFPSFWAFANRYCGAHHNGWGYDFSGASHLDELQDKLRASAMIRREKREVLKSLPPKRRQIIELPREDYEEFVEAEQKAWAGKRDRVAAAQEEADAAHAMGGGAGYATAVKRLRSATAMAFEEIAAARRDLAVAKAPAVAAHALDLLESEGKLVIWAHHHEVSDTILAAIRKGGVEAEALDGRTKMEDRDRLVQAFQADGGLRVLVAGITAAGVGITLTKAQIAVFAELDWVPANVAQAEDRIHRIGQQGSVLIQHLVVDGTLDAQMAKALVEKQEIADRALDRDTALALDAVAPTTPKAARRPAVYPVTTEGEREALHRAMMYLRDRCDGVATKDGQGFSRSTEPAGRSLAEGGVQTDGQAWLARKIATTHRKQLPEAMRAGVVVE